MLTGDVYDANKKGWKRSQERETRPKMPTFDAVILLLCWHRKKSQQKAEEKLFEVTLCAFYSNFLHDENVKI